MWEKNITLRNVYLVKKIYKMMMIFKSPLISSKRVLESLLLQDAEGERGGPAGFGVTCFL
jgi:hypothetical protein